MGFITLIFLASLTTVVLSGQQYTPNQANYASLYSKVGTAHDPNSVSWISSADWTNSQWDGTIYNPSRMTKAAFASAICPSVDRIRGIREVFYRTNPFANNANPTKAEIDEWHRIAINHVRALIGYTSPAYQVQPDICLFARSLWGDERKFTTQWDANYPGTLDSALGPCSKPTSNGHCGATFIPSAADQAPYLPAGQSACGTPGGSEGVFSGPKSNIAWSLKWSRALCNTLIGEGFWGGHVGPFFHRERFGVSFWDPDPSINNNNCPVRFKWGGALRANMYCDPAVAGCDPLRTGPGSILDTGGSGSGENCPNATHPTCSGYMLIPTLAALLFAMAMLF